MRSKVKAPAGVEVTLAPSGLPHESCLGSCIVDDGEQVESLDSIAIGWILPVVNHDQACRTLDSQRYTSYAFRFVVAIVNEHKIKILELDRVTIAMSLIPPSYLPFMPILY